MNNLQSITDLINSSPKIITITTHKNPDGDAIGSSLALMEYLKIKGHKVDVIVPNEIPGFISWMSGSEYITIFDINQEHAESLLNNAEVVFCLDYNSLSRTGSVESILAKVNAKKVLIDHHLFPSDEFDYTFSKTEASSTAELIYELIEYNRDQKLINTAIAENIYVGIVTDTGSFSFSCNRPLTYEIVKTLITLGIDGEMIHRKVYDTFSEDRLRLLGYCLTDRFKVLHEYNTAYIYLTSDDLKRFNNKAGDTEGVVNYALSIDFVRFAALFTERENLIRISFRSKKGFSANNFAQKHFEGGGHENAAGGNSYISMSETLKKFENIIKSYKKELSF